jgi:hypothetical protein
MELSEAHRELANAFPNARTADWVTLVQRDRALIADLCRGLPSGTQEMLAKRLAEQHQRMWGIFRNAGERK